MIDWIAHSTVKLMRGLYTHLYSLGLWAILIKITIVGPSAVAQVVEVLALQARDPTWVPVLIPAAPLPFQLPACGLGTQSRMAQGFGTLHPRGRPRRGSWLRISMASTVALTWGVNHWMEDLPVSPPLCTSAFPINKIDLKRKKKQWSYPLSCSP